MKYFKTPITVNFELTEHCNAECKFCSIRDHGEEPTFAPLGKMHSLIDKFKEAGILRLNLFGGEPFIYPQILSLIRYAQKAGFFISGVTNGLNLGVKTAHEISGLVNVLGVSVHGFEKEHNDLMGVPNAFNKAMVSIDNLHKAKIPVGTNMTVTAKNYNIVYPLIEYLKKEHCISFVALNRYIPNKSLSSEINDSLTLTTDQLRATLLDLKALQEKYPDMSLQYAIHFPFCAIKDEELQRFIGDGCGFGQSYCAVDCYGNMKLCSYTESILGNLFETPLKEIWNTSPLLQEYRSEKWMPARCQNCKDMNMCMAGCKASSGKSFGVDCMLKTLGR